MSDAIDYESKLYKLNYLLEDDEFVMKINVPIEQDIYEQRGDASVIPSGLITTYSKWGRSVPKNLALFYSKNMPPDMPIEDILPFMAIDVAWTDEFFPSCEYGKKYAKCTINQLKLLQFTGKNKHAQLVA